MLRCNALDARLGRFEVVEAGNKVQPEIELEVCGEEDRLVACNNVENEWTRLSLQLLSLLSLG